MAELLAAMLLAGFIVLLAGFIELLFAVELFDIELLAVIGVLIGVLIAAGVLAGVAGLLFAGALLAASPQAMPRALKPRTVESAITFLILSDSYLSQRFYLYY